MGPELSLDYPLDNPSDSSQHSWKAIALRLAFEWRFRSVEITVTIMALGLIHSLRRFLCVGLLLNIVTEDAVHRVPTGRLSWIRAYALWLHNYARHRSDEFLLSNWRLDRPSVIAYMVTNSVKVSSGGSRPRAPGARPLAKHCKK